ncbi:MAG: glycerol-3-phosphate 1-O-acyltransferase PlsY [Andreesenia angusta]|nr:glycerol-3-phosphate 1-O-acyltransferase PlsY [Andreesenia angusta]
MQEKIIIIVVLAYLIGNIQGSYILGKLFYKKDIRKYGSSNAGTTNALRVFGKKFAIATLLIDLLKGVLAVILGRMLLGDIGANMGGFFVIIGHIWPVVMGFKGGKGVATSIGVGLSLTPLTAIISLFIGIAILIKTKYVSLGAIVSVVIWPFLNIYFYLNTRGKTLIIVSFLITIIVILKHRDNITRLIEGKENKVNKKIDIDKND